MCQDLCLLAWAESACCLALCLCICLHLPALSCWACILQGNWGNGLCFCWVCTPACTTELCSVSVVPKWCKATSMEKMVTDFKLFVAFTSNLKTTCADFSTSCLWYLRVMRLIERNNFQFHVLLHYHHVFDLVLVLGAGAATVSTPWLSAPKHLFRTMSSDGPLQSGSSVFRTFAFSMSLQICNSISLSPHSFNSISIVQQCLVVFLMWV